MHPDFIKKFSSPGILKIAVALLSDTSDAFYLSEEVSLATWNDWSSKKKKKNQGGTKQTKMHFKD